MVSARSCSIDSSINPRSSSLKRLDYVAIGLTPGLRSWSQSRWFLGGVGFGFLTILGVRVRFFCPTPDVQLDHFLHHPLELGIPVQMVHILLKLLLR